MGMFDEIHFKTQCPKCGADVDGFQSKDRDCTMALLSPNDVGNFYASCQKCRAWIEYSRYQPKPERPVGEPMTHEQALAVGFTRMVESR